MIIRRLSASGADVVVFVCDSSHATAGGEVFLDPIDGAPQLRNDPIPFFAIPSICV